MTTCETVMSTPESMDARNTNRMIAINGDMLGESLAYWCGREIQIFDASGAQILIENEPFVVWDKCPACVDGHLDMGVLGYVQLQPDKTCGNNNPTGISYKIMDNYIWPGDAPGYTPSDVSSSAIASSSLAASASTQSMAPASSSQAAAVSPSTEVALASATTSLAAGSGTCVAGQYQCSGTDLQVFDPSGTQISIPEGSFILWDECAACAGDGHIDMSAQAFVQLNADKQCGTKPVSGISYKVMDNYVWTPDKQGLTTTYNPDAPDTYNAPGFTGNGPEVGTFAKPTAGGGGGGEESAGSTSKVQATTSFSESPAAASSTAIPSPTSVVTTASSADPISKFQNDEVAHQTSATLSTSDVGATSTVLSTSLAVSSVASTDIASAAATGGCTNGQYQCSGNDLQLCHYASTSALAWITINTCTKQCAVAGSNVTCLT
ncbi:hypothetical protein P7C73_g6495, partial [Tremellales sp. Uapishka_1]